MSEKVNGTDSYIYIAAIARLSGASENTALKYCRKNFEMRCKREGINGNDIIQTATNEITANALKKRIVREPTVKLSK